jgi:hypothetical protein
MLRFTGREDEMDEVSGIDHAVDEVLVNLGAIVLRLAAITARPEQRHALVQSVHQYAVCAAGSADPRVLQLKQRLDATLKPTLRLIAGG